MNESKVTIDDFQDEELSFENREISSRNENTDDNINPIVRANRQALPKIYGSIMQTKYIKKPNRPKDAFLKDIELHPTDSDSQYRYASKKQSYLEQNKSKSNLKKKGSQRHIALKYIQSKEIKFKTQKLNSLSKPKDKTCNKRNCTCHKIHKDIEERQKMKSQFEYRIKPYSLEKVRLGKIVHLPKIKKYESVAINTEPSQHKKYILEDFQSQHKTSRNLGQHRQIRKTQARSTSTNEFGSQINKTVKLGETPELKTNHKKLNQHIRIEDNEEQDGEISISRFLLSKNIFKNGKTITTIFKTLDQKDGKTKPIGYQSIMSFSNSQNQYDSEKTQFQIPTQQDYRQFIEEYKPLSKRFDLMELLQRPNFKIVTGTNSVYFGEIYNGEPNGQGLYVSKYVIFQGKFKNGLKHEGCQQNQDGIYYGGYVNGLREGIGTYEWNNGQTFDGVWKKGVKEGHGIWKSPRGDSYNGEWKANCQHGSGVFKHHLSVYTGNFVNFLKEGEGSEIFTNGDQFKGTYKAGKPNGEGRYDWQDGSYYEGSFKEGLRDGKGSLHDSLGNHYIGEFRNDQKHGFGKEYYRQGEHFQGQFRNGQKIKGILYDRNKVPIPIINK